MASGITVDIKVSPIIKEFFECVNKGEIIKCKKNDFLSNVIKPLLELPPKQYKPIVDNDNNIKIELLYYYQRPQIRNRWYLSEANQNLIYKELRALFKEIFHNYVFAFMKAGGKQTDAINDFCESYNLNLDNINFEMLKKSFDRSEQKNILKNGRYVSHNNNKKQ